MPTVSDRLSTRLVVGAVTLAGLVMVGCSSNENQRIQHGYYPDGRDVTPTAVSSVGDSDAVRRMATFSTDTNLRRLQDDVHRMFFLTDPMSLSPKRGIWY